MTSFPVVVKDINLQKLEKMLVHIILFMQLKFVCCWIQCTVKILEDFTQENSRKSQIKPHQQ